MKKEIDYSKIRTANFADETPDGYNCCSWMDLHHDLEFGGCVKSRPYWVIRIIWIDDEARFIHKVNGKYKSEKLNAGDVISFNASVFHGLLPKSMADEIEARNNCGFYEYKKLKKKLNKFQYQCIEPCRIVWEFLGPDPIGLTKTNADYVVAAENGEL